MFNASKLIYIAPGIFSIILSLLCLRVLDEDNSLLFTRKKELKRLEGALNEEEELNEKVRGWIRKNVYLDLMMPGTTAVTLLRPEGTDVSKPMWDAMVGLLINMLGLKSGQYTIREDSFSAAVDAPLIDVRHKIGVAENSEQEQIRTPNDNNTDKAMGVEKHNGATDLGGIDFNAAHLKTQIKRDGKGVPLPLGQQDMAQLSHIQGFIPRIIEIKSAVNLPIIKELQQKLQPLL